ncbi:MAG TPA: S49 family peptidase [Xanthobacteraceae bacterium]|nr:S49 family peptidase [Xanthobacteraceae bacterium]
MSAELATRLLNRPLLVHPLRAEVLAYVLHERIGISAEPLSPDASAFMGSHRREDGGVRLSRAANGVALVRVTDTLVNKGAWLNASSGLTSYEGIAAQIRDAAADKDVHAILLDIDSPGGEATGMFRLSELIQQVKQQKPVVAFIDDMAASAAYGIASAATEIVVSPTSIVGSIGVVLLHVDRSGELAQKGVRPTLIHAGAHKVDGNPFGPLSKEVEADMQAFVGKFYGQFLDTVADGRGARFSREAAQATEAKTFVGADAVKLGLADRIATLDEVLSGLRATTTGSTRTTSNGRTPMSHDNQTAGITQEAHTAAVSAARDEGVRAGTEAAHARLSAILADDRTKGRERAAMTLACKSPSMSVDDVCAFVAENAAPSASLAARVGGEHTEALPEGGTKQRADEPDFLARAKQRYGVA